MHLRRSTLIKYIFALFVVIVLVYAYFEARNLLYGPQINLDTTGAITVHSELVEINGSVENITELTLDGRPVLTDDTGRFAEKILLAKGLNRFVFEAHDKFKRSKREVLEIVYEPSSTEQHVTKADTITNTTNDEQ